MEEFVRKLKEELAKFEIGEEGLDEVFDPVLEACRKVAKNEDELRQCLIEAISTLRDVVKRTRK